VDARLPSVLTEIRSLLAAQAERPSRAVVEDTLTSGYAYALALEGERLRIERRLRELVRADGEPRARSAEVSRLVGLLAHADQELAGLRALLSNLRAQALA
jgi:hypothetical protein